MIKRGDIYLADIAEGVGSEENGIRPALIVQNNIGNLYSTTVIIIPITSADKRALPTHVYLGSGYGLYLESTALAEQVRTIDKVRLSEYIGSVDDEKMTEIDQALMVSLGIEYMEENI